MLDTAKLFVSGNSQAMRLPKSFRIDATGEVTLQPKPRADDLQDFMALLAAAHHGSDEFVPPRQDAAAADPFADWPAEAP